MFFAQLDPMEIAKHVSDPLTVTGNEEVDRFLVVPTSPAFLGTDRDT